MRHTRHPMTNLAVISAAALLLAGCGMLPGTDGTDRISSSADTSSEADDDLRAALEAEADDLGVELSEEELAEAEAALTGDADGSATVLIDGEPIEFTGTSCYRGSEWWTVEAADPSWGYVQVRFDENINEPGVFKFDEGSIRIISDDPTLESPWGEPGPIVGDETSARGRGIVVDNYLDPDEREASGVEVELEITCHD